MLQIQSNPFLNNFVSNIQRFRLKKNGDVQKGQYRYIKLHTNHKTIYVGDWNNDDSVPTIEELEPRVQVQITQYSGAYIMQNTIWGYTI